MELGHSYYIGRTGAGKSTLMLTNAIEAIENNHGVFFLDPHGADTDTLLKYVPPRRRKDVIFFDPSQFFVSFNPLENQKDKNQTAEAILYSLKDIWRFQDLSTPTFDEYVLHSLLTLLETKNPTLLGMKFLLTSTHYRRTITEQLTDKHLQNFWTDFDALTPKERRDEIRSTKNKFNAILADKRLQRTLGQAKTALSMENVLNGKVCLARLPQGELGIEKTRLLGMLLLCQLHMAGLSRKTTVPFHVFIDECHHFQGKALMEMLSGIRKFNIFLHLAHQYTKQLTPEMRDAVIGNATTKYVFRVGRKDSEWLDEETKYDNTTPKFFELPPFNYRVETEVYEVDPLPPSPYTASDHRTRKCSIENYSRPTAKIDRELARFFKTV